MASGHALRSLALIAVWAAIGLAMALMVAPTAESDWQSYVVAVGVLGLYAWTCVAFVRERRRKRRWT
jgi:hypothetical protein